MDIRGIINPIKRRLGPGSSSTAEGERGSSLVEFSITLLMVVTLLLGVMESARALYSYHFVAHAARQATRYALVRGSSCKSFSTACPATATDIQNYVLSIVPGAVESGGITVTSQCGTPPTGPCTAPNNVPGNWVKVTVQYRFTFWAALVAPAPINMSSSSQMVIAQ